MIKKLLLIASAAATTGCATYTGPNQMAPGVTQVGPYKVGLQAPPVVQQIVTDPGNYVVDQVSGAATSVLGQNIDDPFELAVRANTFILGAFGPNQVNTALNQGIGWYRVGLGVLNNPLRAVSTYTMPWIKN